MEDHKPATILFDEDAGPEVRTATNLNIFGAAFSLFSAIDSSNVPFDLDRRIIHRHGQFI
jgi:hypothetical protein